MEHLPHLSVTELVEAFDYTPSGGGGNQPRPPRVRTNHSTFLRNQLDTAWKQAGQEELVYHTSKNGVYLEFKGEAGYELATKSLENRLTKDDKKLDSFAQYSY